MLSAQLQCPFCGENHLGNDCPDNPMRKSKNRKDRNRSTPRRDWKAGSCARGEDCWLKHAEGGGEPKRKKQKPEQPATKAGGEFMHANQVQKGDQIEYVGEHNGKRKYKVAKGGPSKKKKSGTRIGKFFLMGAVYGLLLAGSTHANQPAFAEYGPYGHFDSQQSANFVGYRRQIRRNQTVNAVVKPRQPHRNPGEFCAVDDGGAPAQSAVIYDPSTFATLEMFAQPRGHVADAGGARRAARGIGTVAARASAGIVLLRDAYYAPSFTVNVVGHAALKRDGFKFIDESNGAHCQLGRSKVLLQHFEGLSHWEGKVLKDLSHVQNAINKSTHFSQGQVNVANATVDNLLEQLAQPDIWSSQSKASKLMTELGRRGVLVTSNPANDKLLAEHIRRGHPSMRATARSLMKKYGKAGLKKRQLSKAPMALCEHCWATKSTRSLQNRKQQTKHKESYCGQTIYSDIVGEFEAPSVWKGRKYEIVLMDGYTNEVTVAGMKDLTEVPTHIANHLSRVAIRTKAAELANRNQPATSTTPPPPPIERDEKNRIVTMPGMFDSTVGSRFHSDAHSVCKSAAARQACARAGYILSTSPPRHHEQNGKVERWIRTMKHRRMATLRALGLGPECYIWCDQWLAKWRNFEGARVNPDNAAPNELAPGAPTDDAYLQPFGCQAWARRGSKHPRSTDKARGGIYLGPAPNSTSQNSVYFPAGDGVRASRVETADARFRKEVPAKLLPGEAPFDLDSRDYDEAVEAADLYQGLEGSTKVAGHDSSGHPIHLGEPAPTQGPEPPTQPQAAAPTPMHLAGPDSNGQPIYLDQMVATVLPPGCVTAPDTCDPTMHEDLGSVNLTIGKQIRSWSKASKHKWSSLRKTAMEKERAQLLERGALAPYPASQIPKEHQRIPSVMLFDMKADENLEPSMGKARWVGLGSVESEHTKGDTFSRPCCWPAIRYCFARAAAKGQLVHCFDIPNGYMQAPTDRIRVIRAPPDQREYTDDGEEIQYLCQNQYGFSAGGPNFIKWFDQWWADNGCEPCLYDDKCYVKDKGLPSEVTVCCHIDDGMVFISGDQASSKLQQKLQSDWEKHGGSIKWRLADMALGVNVAQKPGAKGGITLHQRTYIEKVYDRVSKAGDNIPIGKRSPMPPRNRPSAPAAGSPPPTQLVLTKCQMLIGELSYCATATRPDVSFAVAALGRAQSNPKESDYQLALGVLSYLYRTRDCGLSYVRGAIEAAQAYADASFADCPVTRRSTLGFVACVAGAPVMWWSRTTKSAPQSVAGAELYAMTGSVKDLLWLRRFQTELDGDKGAIELESDSAAALAISKKGRAAVSATRARHIEVKHFFIKDHIEAGALKLNKVQTELSPADCMTKAQDIYRFEEQRPHLVKSAAEAFAH